MQRLSVTVDEFSSAGCKPINQDFHGVCVPSESVLQSKGVVLAVADGISTSDVSGVASETAVKSLLHDYYATSDAWSVKKSVLRVMAATNAWLYAQTRQSPYRYNMEKGYICAFASMVLKSNTATLFHAGDCRIYRIRGGVCEQLTEDHRFGNTDGGYLTRAIGLHQALDLDVSTVQLMQGDRFILATDGVSDTLSAESLVTLSGSPAQGVNGAAELLVNYAAQQGSSDNLTAVVIEVNALPEKSLTELQHEGLPLPAPHMLVPGKEFDGFEILRTLSTSSRSKLVLALDKASDQKMALKVLSTEASEDSGALDNLLMEEWVAGRVHSPHLASAPRINRVRHYSYSLSEYIDGVTLTQWMLDHPQPTLDEVREIVTQIARGLQVLHRNEMVHQDLRPHNIMIDKHGTVKIIDFGATKVAGVSEYSAYNEGILGTAQYTAPECYFGYSATAQSDLFSLGVIAYQLLSGQLPYGNGVSRVRSSKDLHKLHYQSLHRRIENVPSWVDHALNKAVALSPHKRYLEVSEFIYDLKNPTHFERGSFVPLIERNPVAVWQVISAVLFICVIYLLSTR